MGGVQHALDLGRQQQAGSASAEKDAANLKLGRRQTADVGKDRRQRLDLGDQRADVWLDQAAEASVGVEVAVVALRLAKGDVDIQPDLGRWIYLDGAAALSFSDMCSTVTPVSAKVRVT